MQQRVTLITLGVDDYGRAKSFYESLGWTAAADIEDTAFFPANGVVVVLWAREKLAADSGIADDGASWGGITLAHNVESRGEVDSVVEAARSLGATVTREPAETFYGGYAGVFRDLDGHAWEVAFNPNFPLGGFGGSPSGVRMRLAPGCKDAGSVASGASGATEDTADGMPSAAAQHDRDFRQTLLVEIDVDE